MVLPRVGSREAPTPLWMMLLSLSPWCIPHWVIISEVLREARQVFCHQGSNHKEIPSPLPILKEMNYKATIRSLRIFFQIQEQSVGSLVVQKCFLLRTVSLTHEAQRVFDFAMILMRWIISWALFHSIIFLMPRPPPPEEDKHFDKKL